MPIPTSARKQSIAARCDSNCRVAGLGTVRLRAALEADSGYGRADVGRHCDLRFDSRFGPALRLEALRDRRRDRVGAFRCNARGWEWDRFSVTGGRRPA